MGAPNKLLPAQMALLRSVAEIVCFVAGYGSGKTHGACVKALQLASKNPGLIGLFVEPTHRMLKMIAMRDMERTCVDLGVKYRWHLADKMLEVWVGKIPQWTPIYFMSAENPDSLNGPTAAWIILDEAGSCKQESFQKLLGRFRDPKASLMQFIVVGTPEGGPGTWFGVLAEFGTKDQRCDLLIRAKTKDNKHLPKAYLDRMRKKYTPEEFKAYCEGIFVAAGGQVYRWRPEEHLRTMALLDGPGEVQIYADFNVKKVVWLLAKEHNGHVHVFDEIVSTHTYTDEQAKKTKERLTRWGIDPRGLMIYHDSNTGSKSSTATRDGTGRSDIAECRNVGFKTYCLRKNPPIRDRVASVNLMLRGGILHVDPRCSELIKTLSSQGRDDNGQPDKKTGLDHAGDALGYGIVYQFPATTQDGIIGSGHYH